MNKMGGLWRKIPITHWTMLIGTLAIAGIPPLAGFFSKDEILGESFKFGFYWVWAIGFVVAGMTAFYMWRLMGKTFYGQPSEYAQRHLGPDPRVHLDDDGPARPPGDPVRRSWASSWACRFGDSTITHWLEPVFDESEEMLHPAGAAVRAVRRSTASSSSPASASRPSASSSAIWLFGAFRRAGKPARVARPHERQRRDPLPLPRLAQQVVVRRPQPPALHRHRRPRRRGAVVVRPGRRRRHGQRRRPADDRRRPRPAPGPDRPRPELRAGHRDRADRDGRLVPRHRGQVGRTTMDIGAFPILSVITFLPLAGRPGHRAHPARQPRRDPRRGARRRPGHLGRQPVAAAGLSPGHATAPG